MQYYRPVGGEYISDVVEKLVVLANYENEEVATTFNGIEIIVKHGSKADNVVESYRMALRRRLHECKKATKSLKR